MIRPATTKDLDQLVPLVAASDLYQKKELEREQVNEEVIVANTKQVVADFLKKNDWRYFVAEEENKIIGYVLVSVDSAYTKAGSLSDLYVVPAKRRQGVARSLIEKGLAWLKEQQVNSVTIAVHQDNESALKLYRSFGFEPEPDPYLYLKKRL